MQESDRIGAQLARACLLGPDLGKSLQAEATGGTQTGSYPQEADVDAAWLVEIGSRLDDVLEGRVALVDADETYRLISAELAARGR